MSDEDDKVIDLFNRTPDVDATAEWEPPDGYDEVALAHGMPRFGTDDFTAWLDGPQPERAGPGRSEEWKWWMKCRQARTGRKGGRPKKVEVDEKEVVALATQQAADKLTAELVTAATLAMPHRAKAVTALVNMLESKDEGKRLQAAKLLLEITDGKPAATLIERQDGPKVIEYRTVALMAEVAPFRLGAGVDSPGDAIATALEPLDE